MLQCLLVAAGPDAQASARRGLDLLLSAPRVRAHSCTSDFLRG